MKKKSLFLLPGAIALMLAASPMIPVLNQAAVANPSGVGGARMKFGQLNLTDAQQAQMRQIQESTRQQMNSILTPEQQEQMRLAKEQRQRPNLNLTPEQQSRMQEIWQNAKTQMQAVLTPEQQQQLQESRQQWRQRRQQQSEGASQQ
ncbi:MAG: Spy/CpxP family protein refolding chaperone [Kastovskya adunca ATA6-11-RM4]|jgi:Spy/CpxP family protein refolding chaperone|nr:Spy/CpxP family protein refolding chaperone [Kastovskya adunca ATA6-11-RM4]